MAELNPGALFPRGDNYIPPAFAAPAQLDMMKEAQAQAAMQSRLAQMEEERQRMLLEQQRADQPLFNQQRQVKMGTVEGELARQPDVLEQARVQARGGAERAPIEANVLSLEAQAKQRALNMKTTADEMDTIMQAFSPVIKSAKTADYAGTNESWEAAFKHLEKAGYDTSQYRMMPRDKLLSTIKEQYEYAVNNVPAIRERIKADEAQSRLMERVRSENRSRERAAAARTASTFSKPAKRQEELATKYLEEYGKGTILSPSQKAIVTEFLDNTPNPAEREIVESFYQDDEKHRYMKQRRERLRRQYPELYSPQLNRNPPSAPTGGNEVDFSSLPKKK